MMPNDGLPSSQAIVAAFVDPLRGPVEYLYDYEFGGIALNDGSQGLNVQLWELRVVNDKTRVQVAAPNTPWTTLFDRTNPIQEAALAFDNNMNPFVVFTEEGGAAFYYWFDTADLTQKITALPDGCVTPRCCIDDKRTTQTSISDVVLAYLRGGSLYVRYQRERYTVEHLWQAGLGVQANIIDLGMNRQLRLQFWLRNANPVAGTAVFNEPFLGDVVKDLCIRSGLRTSQIDVTELYEDFVPGMLVASDEGYSEQIDWLRDMFMFDKAVYDKKVNWRKRNREPVAWIPYSDLVATSPVALEDTLADEQKLPREVNINHIDPNGGYAKNKQTASRRSNLVNARKKETIDSQLVLTVDQAATVALTKLKMYWGELVDYKFSTTIKYTRLTVTDVVMVEDAKGVWHRMQLRERNEDGKIIEWEAKQHGGEWVYGSKAYGNALPPPTSTTPGLVGETRFEILNLPALTDASDELGLFLAACGESTAWNGYQLLFSIDQGATYTEAFSVDTPSVIGDTLTQLEAEPEGYSYPSSQTVQVLVNFPLESVSYDQLMMRKNLCVIGDELLQFQTAELIEKIGERFRYRLSGLLRGRFYMPAETWAAGIRFVLIDPTVVFAPVQRSYLGMDLWYKAVSFGHSVDETTPVAYLYDEGISQREFPVSSVEAERDGSNNVTVTWVGAARLGFDTTPYHSKYFRGYRVKFSNGHTIDTMSLTATYNAAPGGVTVQVCALNEITGEGPYSTAIAT